MNNDLMRYRIFTEPVEGLGVTSIVTGRVDMQAMLFSTLNFFLIDIPFRGLAFLTDIIVAFLNLLDFTNGFSAMRQQFFDQSNQIFLRFIGGANGRITTGSIAFSFLSVALIYLTFQFFFGKGNFAKKAIHVMVVVMLGFGYFGTFNQNGKSVRGGIWLLDTVDNVATELRGSMITSFTFDDTEGSPTNETASLTKYFENHVVKNTWKFLHSGSFTGEFASGQSIDVNMLISNEDLSGSDLEAFETARDEYLTEIAEVNAYVRNTPDYFVQKMFMVALGYANMLILGLPILFANLTISAFQLVLFMLVLLFPFALLLSFIPMMRNAAFNMLKMMLGILFIPVLLSFLLGVIFYLNQAIDSLILARAGQLFGMGTGALTMANLPVGNTLLILFSMIVIVKGFFLHLIWKNKGRILQLISGGALDDRMINQPKEVMGKAVDKAKEVGETALGAGKVALGASIGQPGLIADGIVQAAPTPVANQPRHSKHFMGEDGKLDVQGGLSSMKDRVFGRGEQKGEEIPLSKSNENDAQDVNVVNSEELVNDDLGNNENIIMDDKVPDEEQQQVNHEVDFDNLVVRDDEYSQEESYEVDVENVMIPEMEKEIVNIVTSDELANDDLESNENIIIDDKVSDEEQQQVKHEVEFENLVVQDSEYSQEEQGEQEESYEVDVENMMIPEVEKKIVNVVTSDELANDDLESKGNIIIDDKVSDEEQQQVKHEVEFENLVVQDSEYSQEGQGEQEESYEVDVENMKIPEIEKEILNVVTSDELVNDDLESKENIIMDDKVSDKEQKQGNHEVEFENLVVQDSEYSQEGQGEQEESYEADVENTMILERENEIVSDQEEIPRQEIQNDELLVPEQEIEVSTMADQEAPAVNGKEVSNQFYTEGEDVAVQEQEKPKSISIESRQMRIKEIPQGKFISQEPPVHTNDKQQIHTNDNRMTETMVHTNKIDSRQTYHSSPNNDFANMIQQEIPNRLEDYTKIEQMSQEDMDVFLKELDRERMA